jgi:hypothetical protein
MKAEEASTTARRPYSALMVLALFLFISFVITDTFGRYPVPWFYIFLHDLHFQLSRLGLGLALLMAGIAVYVGILRKGDVTPLFRKATYVIVLSMVIQSLVGLVMLTQQAQPREEVHFIYGMAAVLALPFFIFVEITAKKRPAMGSYIWGFTLLLGVIIRSIMTGA